MKNYLIVGKGNMGLRYESLLRERDPECIINFKTSRDRFGDYTGEEFDAAFICTPSDSHVQMTYDMFNVLGPIPTLIEKPLTNNATEEEMDMVAHISHESIHNRVAVYVAYNLRFTGIMIDIKANLEEHRFGIRPLAMCKTSAFKWPGKRPLDSAHVELSHEMDYLRYLFGDIVSTGRLGDDMVCQQYHQHVSGVVSYTYLDMDTDVEERYFTYDPHDHQSNRFHFNAEDIEFSYTYQLTHFLLNKNNPAIDNNINEVVLIREEDE